jgi:hypothetical protein
MRHGATKKTDAIVLLAKAAFRDRRRRSPLILLTLAVVIVLVVAIPVWWFWPRSELPRLLLAAFDEVGLPGEPVRLCAGIEPVEGERTHVSLVGFDLYYQEPPNTELLGKALTDQAGLASLDFTWGERDRPAEVLVRYPGKGGRQRGVQASARIFVWPPQSSLLVVDTDSGLVTASEAKLWTTSSLDLHPVTGAAASLQKASAKFRIVYLSGQADRPSRYAKLRAWLERPAPASESLPPGPLLATACESVEQAGTSTVGGAVARLCRRFRSPLVGVTGDCQNAKVFLKAGLSTYLIGDQAEVPDGAKRTKSWNDLARLMLR